MITHDFKMADPLKYFLCFSVTFLCFSASLVNAIHVMQQDSGCTDIVGTWEHKNEKISSTLVYYKISLENSLFRLETTANFDDLEKGLPFDGKFTTSADPYLKVILVERENIFKNILHMTSSSKDECVLSMNDGSVLKKIQTIRQVHVVYMNHLDVGYNTNQNYPGTNVRMPGFIVNVLNWYFQVYFPRAAKLGNDLRDIRANETFKYTTHPWLVNLFLDCPDITLSLVKLQCPNEKQVETFRRAVWMGDITWHAGPLNQEPESSNPELFDYSLSLSEKLDKYFGIKRTARTLSQRDIPGMTQAAIPYLVNRNIVAASFGVNGASAPPDVPSPNVWKFGNYSIISYWHKGGYPDSPGKDPQHPGGLGRNQCQLAAGVDHALCFAFRSDNYGPPQDIEEIKSYFKILRYQFPGALIKASTLEAFTAQLLPIRNKLPVVNQEIGDTWIQGPASDPIKNSHYRTINRLRSECLRKKECDPNDKRFDDFSRLLIKGPEHTYGISSAFDQKHYSNEDFQPLQYLEIGYRNDTMTWLSHRHFIDELAVNALKDHPLKKKIKEGLKELDYYLPHLDDYKMIDVNSNITCANGMKLRIGKHGGLVTLVDTQGRDWASEASSLSQILYRTYNLTDFQANHKSYDWRCCVGFDKPNMNYTKAESKFWDVEAHGVYVKNTGDPCNEGIFVRIIHQSMQSWYKYGAPVSYFLKYQTVDSGLNIDYQFFNKPSTRLPEALFLNFAPSPKPGHKFYIHKLGYPIDPMTTVNNGSAYVHACDKGVAYLNSDMKGLLIQSFDVATVAVQTADHVPSPFPMPLTPMKSPPTGMAFNFYNNIWETNFIFWYPYQPQDKHYKARFRLTFQ